MYTIHVVGLMQTDTSNVSQKMIYVLIDVF